MLHEAFATNLLNLLAEQGFTTADFVREQQADTGTATVIRHKPSGYYFKLRAGTVKQLDGTELPVACPSYTPDTTGAARNPNQERAKHPTEKLLSILSNFNEWLSVLKQEGAISDR